MTTFTCHHFEALDPRELYTILRLRQEVFVVEQECAYLDADEHDLEGWHVLGREPDGRVVAYARVLPPGTTYPDHVSIGRVLTVPDRRGSGVARALMESTLGVVAEQFPRRPVKISAQSYLIDFYASFGFRRVGEPYLEDGIEHVAMVLDARDAV